MKLKGKAGSTTNTPDELESVRNPLIIEDTDDLTDIHSVLGGIDTHEMEEGDTINAQIMSFTDFIAGIND